ncbi:MAG: OadG family protein [Halioglobus sp.]|nr:OadG family protein [Halioglobus sp.]
MEQGLQLMLFGMGTVLLFLTLLVLATRLMSYVLIRFFPPVIEPLAQTGRVGSDAAVAHSQHIAAIAAAIHRYRSDHR